MPELHKLTPTLGVLQDRGHKVALVTDGRMSGASGKVPAAIHVTPEAARRRRASRKIRDGDVIRLDAPARHARGARRRRRPRGARADGARPRRPTSTASGASCSACSAPTPCRRSWARGCCRLAIVAACYSAASDGSRTVRPSSSTPIRTGGFVVTCPALPGLVDARRRRSSDARAMAAATRLRGIHRRVLGRGRR